MVIDCQLQISYNSSTMMGNAKQQRGFTIVEVLVVIAVLSILIAVGSYGFTKMRERAYDAKVETVLNEVEKAISLYRSKHGSIPPLTFNTAFLFSGGPQTLNLDNFRSASYTTTTEGGFGERLVEEKLLSSDIESRLDAKNWQNAQDLSTRIQYVRCVGFNEYTKEYTYDYALIWVRSFDGIDQSDFRDMRANGSLGCPGDMLAEKKLWVHQQGGDPRVSIWGWSSGLAHGKVNYKYRKVNLK